MKKVLFAIFAHPDDEAFGPAGALLMEARAGTDVHLITFTLGDAGSNPDNVPDLAALREAEWKESGRRIGASSMHFLGYRDGHLDNLTMIEAQDRIVALIQEAIRTTPDMTEIELLSMDPNGISGHIDHVVASRSAHYAFYRLKAVDPRVTRLRLACVPREQLPAPSADWLFAEAGRSEEEIGDIVDARAYRDEIIAIMRAHHSQRGDGESHIERRGDQLGIHHFMVRS